MKNLFRGKEWNYVRKVILTHETQFKKKIHFFCWQTVASHLNTCMKKYDNNWLGITFEPNTFWFLISLWPSCMYYYQPWANWNLSACDLLMMFRCESDTPELSLLWKLICVKHMKLNVWNTPHFCVVLTCLLSNTVEKLSSIYLHRSVGLIYHY